MNNKYTVQPFNFNFNCQIAELMFQGTKCLLSDMLLTTVKDSLSVLGITPLCLNFSLLTRIMLQSKGLFYSFLTAFQLVFSKLTYIAIAGFTSIVFWVIFNILDELLFFSPVFTFYLPDDAIGSFIISSITAPLLGAVVAMNVYVFRNSRLKLSRASFFQVHQ